MAVPPLTVDPLAEFLPAPQKLRKTLREIRAAA